MPDHQATPAQPSEEQVLAALERALRHRRQPQSPGVLLSTIEEHLGLSRHGSDTRRLQPVVDALHVAGAIESSVRQGLTLWRLTSAGKRRLAAASGRDAAGQLPESPQHQEWRNAREAAERRIDPLRNELEEALERTRSLLDVEQRDSDVWFAASRELQRACYRLGSATYCLYEWTEPDDAEVDRPPERLVMRRDWRAWR
jgi:hypothetical protein